MTTDDQVTEPLRDYDFMRCAKCGRLITRPEMARALAGQGEGAKGAACPCGSLKYQPTNLPWWGWLLPRVWAFAWQRVREIGIKEALRRDGEEQA